VTVLQHDTPAHSGWSQAETEETEAGLAENHAEPAGGAIETSAEEFEQALVGDPAALL
jgi:hypothetical protein